jgi:hypothetical protein
VPNALRSRLLAAAREPVIDITTDREGRVEQLSRQFERQNTRSSQWVTSYRPPTEAEMMRFFTARPEAAGRILRDLLLESFWKTQPKRWGRKPNITLTPADVLAHLPRRIALALLPPEYLPDAAEANA